MSQQEGPPLASQEILEKRAVSRNSSPETASTSAGVITSLYIRNLFTSWLTHGWGNVVTDFFWAWRSRHHIQMRKRIFYMFSRTLPGVALVNILKDTDWHWWWKEILIFNFHFNEERFNWKLKKRYKVEFSSVSDHINTLKVLERHPRQMWPGTNSSNSKLPTAKLPLRQQQQPQLPQLLRQPASANTASISISSSFRLSRDWREPSAGRTTISNLSCFHFLVKKICLPRGLHAHHLGGH